MTWKHENCTHTFSEHDSALVCCVEGCPCGHASALSEIHKACQERLQLAMEQIQKGLGEGLAAIMNDADPNEPCGAPLMRVLGMQQQVITKVLESLQ